MILHFAKASDDETAETTRKLTYDEWLTKHHLWPYKDKRGRWVKPPLLYTQSFKDLAPVKFCSLEALPTEAQALIRPLQQALKQTRRTAYGM